MNVNSGQSHEAQFGPPSPLINVSQFVRSAVQVENESPDQASCSLFSQSSSSLNAKAREDRQKIDQRRHEAIEAECRFVLAFQQISSVLVVIQRVQSVYKFPVSVMYEQL